MIGFISYVLVQFLYVFQRMEVENLVLVIDVRFNFFVNKILLQYCDVVMFYMFIYIFFYFDFVCF